VIWVHALSLGEVVSAVPLVRALGEGFPQRKILFTATTAQGMETAEKELGGTVWALRPMPLDFWWSVRRFVRRTNPSVFLLVETDIWPGLLAHLKNKGVSAILVNGRVSPRTMRSYARFKPVFRHIYKGFHRCLMQTDLDRDRLLRLGLDQGRVVTAGNLKFDRAWEPLSPEERSGWFRTLGLEPERPVLVAGSTHPGEEEMVLEACERARRVAGDFCLIIAPRRVERAEEVARAAGARGFRTAMRSAGPRRGPPWDVLILDTIGELGRVYGLGHAAFVGGSLVPFGGHNLLEPASFGSPVLFGPYTHNFEEMAEALLRAGGGRRVRDEEEMAAALRDIFREPDAARAMGARARGFVEENRGALARVLDVVAQVLENAEGTSTGGAS